MAQESSWVISTVALATEEVEIDDPLPDDAVLSAIGQDIMIYCKQILGKFGFTLMQTARTRNESSVIDVIIYYRRRKCG